MDLIRTAESSFSIPPPSLGQGPYVILPDMTYTWRVWASSKSTFAPPDSSSWGPWSEARTFRTPVRDSSRITPVTPADGATMRSGAQVLQWNNVDKDVFYYEVQASSDPKFGEEGPAASVWHNLIHGGVTPLNSWTPPNLETWHVFLAGVAPGAGRWHAGGLEHDLEL